MVERTFDINQSALLPQLDTAAELHFNFNPNEASRIGVKLYSDAHQIGEGFLGKVEAPLATHRGFDFRVVLDRASVEVFAQNRTLAVTSLSFPPTQIVRSELSQIGANMVRVKSEVWRLQSM